jgi:Fur family ferric uptake transcriptional regulator
LRILTRLGLVDELDLMHVSGERHFYEVRPASFHIHLVCTSCGGVQEPGGPFWEKLASKVRRETGFRADAARLEMGGTCSDCRARRGGSRAND